MLNSLLRQLFAGCTHVRETLSIDGARALLASNRLEEAESTLRALCIADPKNAYRYLQLRGKIAEITQEGAEEHIDALNLKYHGNPNYPYHNPAHPRVIYKFRAEHVDAH